MKKNIAIIVLSVVAAALGTILYINRKCFMPAAPKYIESDNGVMVLNVENIRARQRSGYLECNCPDGTFRLCREDNNSAGCGQCCGREIRVN